MRKTLQLISATLSMFLLATGLQAQSSVSNIRVSNAQPCFGENVTITATYTVDASLTNYDVDFNINGFDSTVTFTTAGDQNITVPSSRVLVGNNTFTIDTVGNTAQNSNNVANYVGRSAIDLDFNLVPDNNVCTGENIVLGFSNISGGDTLTLRITLNGTTLTDNFTVIPNGPGQKLTDTIYAASVNATPQNQNIVIQEITDDAGCSVMPSGKSQTVTISPNPNAAFASQTDLNRLGFVCDNDENILVPIIFSNSQNNAKAFCTITQNAVTTSAVTGANVNVGAGMFRSNIALNNFVAANVVDNIQIQIDSVTSGAGATACITRYGAGSKPTFNFDLHQSPNTDLLIANNPVCAGIDDTLSLMPTAGDPSGLFGYFKSQAGTFNIELANNEYVAAYTQTQNFTLDSVNNDFCLVSYNESRGTLNVNPLPNVNVSSFDNVCIGQQAEIDVNIITGAATDTYFLRYRINGPAGMGDSIYTGLSSGLNTLLFNAPSASASTGSYTITIDSVSNQSTGCSSVIVNNVTVDNMASNNFMFDVTDTLDATVLFNGASSEFICAPVANGSASNTDSVEVRFYVTDLPLGVSTLQFTYNQLLNGGPKNNNLVLNANTADFVMDNSVAPYTAYFQFSIETPTDSLALELLSLQFTDANGNACTSNFDLAQPQYTAQASARPTPSAVITSNSATEDCNSLSNIVYNFTVSNLDSIQFYIDDVSDPMNVVRLGTSPSYIGNLGDSSTFSQNFNQLAAIASVTINEDVFYRITFDSLYQSSDANFPTCAYDLNNVSFDAYLIPTPTLVSFVADPTVICDDSTSTLTLVAKGNFQFAFDLVRTSPGAEVTRNRFNFNASAVYDAGADETSFSLPVLPDSTAMYEVDSLFLSYMGQSCRVELPSPNTATVTVEQTITSISLTSNVTTICSGQNVMLTVAKQGGAANFNYDIERSVNGTPVDTFSYNQASSPISRTLNETSTFRILNVRNNTAQMCPSNVTDSESINVRPNAFASYISSDSVFCSYDTPGILMAISAVGTADLVFNVFDNATSTALPNFNTSYTLVNDTDTVFIQVPLIPGQNYTYTLQSISDDSSPVCVSALPGESAVLEMNILPIAQLNLVPSNVCFNGNTNIQLNLAGGNAVNNTQITYALRYANGGGSILGTPNPRLNVDSSLANGPFFNAATLNNLTQDTTIEVFELTDANGCVSNVVVSANAIVRDQITVTNFESVSDTICHNDSPQYILEFNQTSTDFDVYANGSSSPLFTTQSGDTITRPGGLPGFSFLTIDSVAYAGSMCYTPVNLTDSVFIPNQATVQILNSNPNDSACFGQDVIVIFRSTLGSGVINVMLNDGMGNTIPFSFNASTTDTLVLSNLLAGAYDFNIASATYTVDQNTCDASITPANRVIRVKNEILASISVVDTDVCADDNIPFVVDLSPDNNTFPYTLRYSVDGVLDSVQLTQMQQTINLSLTASADVIFTDIYESNGLMCMAIVNQTFPITVRNRPTVTINSVSQICEEQNTLLNLSFTGVAPYNTRISNFGNFVFTNANGSGDTSLTVSPANTTTYAVTELTDASQQGCANALLMPQPSTTINVVTKPVASITVLEDTICQGTTLNLMFRVDNAVPNVNNRVRLTFRGVGGTNQTIDLNAVPSVPGSFEATVASTPNNDLTYQVLSVVDGSSPACNFSYSNVTQNISVFQNITASINTSSTQVCDNESVNLSVNINGRAGSQVRFTLRDELGNDSIVTVPTGSVTNFNIANIMTDKMFSLVNVAYVRLPSCMLMGPVPSVSINHNEAANAEINFVENACAGQEFEFELDITSGEGDVTVTFQTDKQGPTFNFTGDVANSPYRIPFTYNTADSLEIRIVNVTSTSAITCPNSAFIADTVRLRVFPLPNAQITVDRPTIVAGSSANLMFDVSGDTVGNPENIRVEYSINGTGGNFVEDMGVVPGFVTANNAATPFHTENVTPTATSTYNVIRVSQGACVSTAMDDVTVNVVQNRALAISGSGNFCTSDSLPVTFSVANGEEYIVDVRVSDGTDSYLYVIRQANGSPALVADGDIFNVPNFNPTTSLPFVGPVTITINSASRQPGGTTLNSTDNPPPFAGMGTFNVQEVKTVTMVSDTTGCFGQVLPVTFTIEGTGEFNIAFRSNGNGNVNRTFTASENDSPVNININPSELDLGEHNFVFGVTPVNSLSNSCPIDTVGSARIYVKPTITSSLNFLPESACEGEPVEISVSVQPDSLANVSFRIDRNGTSTFSSLSGIQGDSVLFDSFIAQSNVTYTILNVEYSDAPSCTNPTVQSRTLQVTPQPTGRFVDMVSDTNICFGETADLRLQFTSGRYPVNYTFTDSVGITRNLTFFNAQGFQDTVVSVNPTTTTRFYLTKVTQVQSPGCSSLMFDEIDVEVGEPLILNSFRLSADTICQGDPLAILVDVDGTPDITARFTDGVSTFIRTLPNATGFDTIVINPSPQVDRTYTLIDITDGSSLACSVSLNVSDDIVVRQRPSIDIVPMPTTVCFGDSVRLRVTINAEDSVTFTISDQIDNFARTFTNIGPGTQFINIRPNLQGINNFTVDSLFYVKGVDCKVFAAETFTVRTNQIPNANLFVAGTAKDTTLCEGFPVDIRFTASGTGLRTIFFANDRGFSSSFTLGASEVSRTLQINPFPETGLIKYFITRVVSNNGAVCDSIPNDTVRVMVNPTPTVDISADLDPRCLNDLTPTIITFNFNGVGPFNFTYTDGENIFNLTADSDNDGDGRLDEMITVAPGKTTTYNVTRISDVTLPNNCVNNGGNAYTLTVNQPAEAELFNNNDVICSGEPLNLSYFVRGKAPISVTFRISDGAGFVRDTLISGLSTGLYSLAFIDTARTPTNTNYTVNIVQVTDGNIPQCTTPGVGVARVTVNALPRISNFMTVLDTICQGDMVDLTFNITNGFGNYAVVYGANGVAIMDTVRGLPSGGGLATIPLTPTNQLSTYRRRMITDLLTGCSTTYPGTMPDDTVVVLRNPVVTVTNDASVYCSNTMATVRVSVVGNAMPNGIFLDNIFLNGNPIPGAPFAINQQQTGNPAFFRDIAVGLPAGTPQNSIITFGTVTDGYNLSNPNRTGGCDKSVEDTLRFTVNPVAMASVANPVTQTICETDTARVLINLVGNGQITVRLAIIDGTDTIASPMFTGTQASSPLTYSTADFNVVGRSIRYAIDTVFSNSNGLNCPGAVGTPSSKTYVIKGNPMVRITPMDTTICQGDDLTVRFNITPVGAGNGPYDLFYVFNGDTTEFFNQGNSFIDVITPTDSGVLYVPFVTNRSTPTCFSADSVGIQINVNPKANAVFLDSAPLAYCQDDAAGFNLRLTGEGQITALFRNLNTNRIDSFTNVAGDYFVPVVQNPNTTATYQILAVNDQSTPRCVETNFPGNVRITVYPRPQARLSGAFTTCEGDVSTVGIQLIGSNADSIIVYYSDKLNGTIDTSFSARAGSYSQVLMPLDTAFFTIDSVAYVNFGCTITDPALINQDTARIFVRPLPEATIVVPSIESCNGVDIPFDIQFAFDGPYDLSYRINNNMEQNASNVNGNFIVTVPMATDTTELVVTSLVYRGTPQCASENVDSITVNVNDSLMVNITDTICNDIATGFRFALEIEGGMASSYSFNGSTMLLPIDSTPEIPNGTYSFTIQDGSGCPALTFAGDYTCDCISDAGTFNIPTAALEFCEDDTADAVANYIGGAVTDANDTMLFILHDSPNATLGNVFATDSVARFAYTGNILFNQVYYISALVADSINGADYDGADRCLSVAAGVPIVFRERSTATIELLTNDSMEVCNGNILKYRFIFDGTGPYVVTWNDGVSTRTQTFVSNITAPIMSQAPIAGNGVVDITSFVDNGNMFPCNTLLNSPLPYTARPLPDPVFDVSDDTPCGFDIVNFSIRNPDANTTYAWLIDGEPFNGNPVTYAFDMNGPALARSYATNQFGCVDSADRIITVNLPVVPTITFNGNSVAGRICRNDALTFTADVINGANSTQVAWFLNGTLVQLGISNQYSPAAFSQRGIYTLVAENRFNGCTNSDTLIFEVQGPGAIPIFDDEFCVDEEVLFGLTNVNDVSAVQWTLTGAQTIVRNNSNFSISLPEGFPSNDIVNVTLALQSAAGCMYDTTFDITVHDLDVQLDNFNDFNNLQRHCLGFEDTFVPTQTSFSNVFTTWDYNFGDGNTITRNDAAGVTNTYAAPGMYKASVELTDQFGCKDTDTLNIEILALPEVQAVDTFACLSENLTVLATGATMYSWTSVPLGAFASDPIMGDEQQVQTNIPGSYDIQVVGTDDEGCMNTANINVDIFNLESPLIRDNYRAVFDTAYKIGYDLPLNYDLMDTSYIYSWTPATDITCVDCPTPTISTFDSRLYTLNITDVYGCFEAEAIVNITIERENSLDMPDAFTPNSGIVNRTIGPDGWALDVITTYQIFDKKGNLVHDASGKKEDVKWDGTFKGKILEPQSFTYRVIATTLIGETLSITGTFDLLR